MCEKEAEKQTHGGQSISRPFLARKIAQLKYLDQAFWAYVGKSSLAWNRAVNKEGARKGMTLQLFCELRTVWYHYFFIKH